MHISAPRIASAKMLPVGVVASAEMLPALDPATMARMWPANLLDTAGGIRIASSEALLNDFVASPEM
jgi:hypothetical protein